MSFTVKVEGLREVQTALRELLPDATARRVMRKVLMTRAQPIIDAAQSLAPVDPRGKHALRESIAASGTLRRSQRSSSVSSGDKDSVWVFVGPSSNKTKSIFHYAHIQEFGSVKQSARPFMRPAWDGAKGTLLDNIGRDMMTEIEKSARRLAKKAGK